MKQKTIREIRCVLGSMGVHLYYDDDEINNVIKAYKQVKAQKKKDKEVPKTISNDHVIEALEMMKRQERLRRMDRPSHCPLTLKVEFTGSTYQKTKQPKNMPIVRAMSIAQSASEILSCGYKDIRIDDYGIESGKLTITGVFEK